jgi:hypothetical protein
MSDKPIGYGHPPVHSQFKKGQSGNPGGRKNGSRNFKTILAAVMESEIELSDKGKKRSVPLMEALLLQLAQCGLKGDWKAIESLFDRYERHALDRTEPDRELPEDDAEMLDQFLERKSNRPSPVDGQADDDEADDDD